MKKEEFNLGLIRLGARAVDGADLPDWEPSDYLLKTTARNEELVLCLKDSSPYGWIVPLSQWEVVKKFLEEEGVIDYTAFHELISS